MADDSRFYRGMFLLTFVFGAGFVCGYQFKTWRLEWLKRRRERLPPRTRKQRNERTRSDLLSQLIWAGQKRSRYVYMLGQTTRQ